MAIFSFSSWPNPWPFFQIRGHFPSQIRAMSPFISDIGCLLAWLILYQLKSVIGYLSKKCRFSNPFHWPAQNTEPTLESVPVEQPFHWPSQNIKPTLERVPVELFLAIASYLTTTDRAALALASQTGLSRLGRAATAPKDKKDQEHDPDDPDDPRWDLLIRLERDGVHKEDILCPGCKVFHPPHLSIVPGWYFELTKPLRSCGSSCNFQAWTSPYLPAHIHFNILAAVMRSYRLYDSHIERTFRHKPCQYPKIHCHSSVKIVNGRLLLKTETLILPCRNLRGLENASVFNNARIFRRAYILTRVRPWHKCCAHHSWKRVYDYVFDETAASDKGELDLFRRIWSNRRLRTGSKYQINRLGLVKSCTRCFTDFALGITDLRLASAWRRVFIVTIWKDLGSGESPDDARWRSHLFGEDRVPRPEVQPFRHGEICQEYEQVDGKSGIITYTETPPIHPSSLKDFSA